MSNNRSTLAFKKAFQKTFKRTALSALCLTALMTGLSASSFADPAEDLFFEAYDLYAARGDLANLDPAISKLNLAHPQTTDRDLDFQITLLLARCYYYKGAHTPGDESKKDLFKRAMDAADLAIGFRADLAEGYYIKGISLARWGEANGIASSVGKLPELKELLAKAESRSTFDGLPGVEYDGYGIYRTRGRIIDRVPGPVRTIRGWTWSNEEGVAFLRIAYERAGFVILNGVFYAEILIGNNKGGQACNLLSELLVKNPDTLNPDRIPENHEEMVQARDLFNRSCR